MSSTQPFIIFIYVLMCSLLPSALFYFPFWPLMEKRFKWVISSLQLPKRFALLVLKMSSLDQVFLDLALALTYLWINTFTVTNTFLPLTVVVLVLAADDSGSNSRHIECSYIMLCYGMPLLSSLVEYAWHVCLPNTCWEPIEPGSLKPQAAGGLNSFD